MHFLRGWADSLLHWFYICPFIDLMFCSRSTYFDANSPLTWKTCCHSCGGPASGADRYWHTPWEWGGCRGSYRCSGEYISWWSSILSFIIYGISVCIVTFSWELIYNINSMYHPKNNPEDFCPMWINITAIIEIISIRIWQMEINMVMTFHPTSYN